MIYRVCCCVGGENTIKRHHIFASNVERRPGRRRRDERAAFISSSSALLLAPSIVTHVSLRARVRFQQIKPSVTSKKKSDKRGENRTETSHSSPREKGLLKLLCCHGNRDKTLKSRREAFFFLQLHDLRRLWGRAQTRNNFYSVELQCLLK